MSDLVAKALAVATKDESARQKALEDALQAQAVADAAFLASGSDKDLESASRARLRAERAKALHASAVDALEAARARHRQVETERAQATLAADIATLEKFPDALVPLHDRLVQLDRDLDALLLAYARTVAAGAAAYDDARTRAQSLGGMIPTPRPTLADVVQAARIVATRARRDEDREDAADLVTSIDLGWKTADMNASERAMNARSASRARGADHDTRIASTTLSQLFNATASKE